MNHLPTHSYDSDEVLTASMVALCGLRCYKQAIDLFDSQPITSNSSATMVYKYAMSSHARLGTLTLGNPWVGAYRHIEKLTSTVKMVQEKTVLDKEEIEALQQMLARTMNSCTNAHQPSLSLLLLEWVQNAVFPVTFNTQQSNQFPFNDWVTAEIINARRWSQDLSGAVEMFERCIVDRTVDKDADQELRRQRMTVTAGLSALIASGRGKDAIRIFHALDDTVLTTDCYTIIARHFAKEKEWKELIELYRDATVQGYSCEDLSLMAMHAVTSTKVDNRLRILRAIVDECAASGGVDPQSWTTSRYWHIKRELGFHHARLLMWWNDPDIAPLDELHLAIKQFYTELSNELRPKNDVVRAIVAGTKLLNSMDLASVTGYEKVPRGIEQWKNLLGEVLDAIRDSPIRYDPNFVDHVVMGYKLLGCNRECVDYVTEVLNVDGTRIRKSTLVEALQAAKLEHAMDLSNDIQMLLSRGERKPEM
jgi:hypothetical protein